LIETRCTTVNAKCESRRLSLTTLLLSELEREAARTRNTLAAVPTDREAFVPHPKSMPLGRLAGLVATVPSWVSLIIEKDELDLADRPH